MFENRGAMLVETTEKLSLLRTEMEKSGIDIYVVPTADFHQSEYVGEHFKARKWLSNFSGSAGTLVVTMDKAGLWTDGRYFLQAAKQLEGTTIELYKMGVEGVPTIEAFIQTELPENGTLGFDGRVVSLAAGKSYQSAVENKHGKIKYDVDLVNDIWEDRPPLSTEPAFHLDIKYTGESTADKLKRIREKMAQAGTDTHVITSLDDIGWTLNFRGNDIEYFPLVLSYLVITPEQTYLFINQDKLDDEIKNDLSDNNVTLKEYNAVYDFVKDLDSDSSFLIDPVRLNYALYNNLPADAKKVEEMNPTVLFKAVKNPIEIENFKKAQVKDGIAHAKFIYWLKKNVGNETITELSASDKLNELRAAQGGFIRPSFAPICGFGPHGAIVHYESTPETNVELEKGNLFLTDTGAGFYEGSTDITRTTALGEISQEMKEDYTTTLISNMQLAHAIFLKGTNGVCLDMMARQPFWKKYQNYNHGTGHGVGYLLNIHEAPAGFRWQYRPGEAYPFQPGMIVTNEPGIYIENSHGVRLENELLVKEAVSNQYGDFLEFEEITYVPFDLEAIDQELLSDEEKSWLNDYHKNVFDIIAPHLDEDEKEWLAEATRAI